MTISIDEMAAFCKRKGFVYPNSEIYGGMAGFYDYGPLGVELKNNIKSEWWKAHVQARPDIVGIDGTIITHPKVWIASQHLTGFSDRMLECSKCNERVRADQFVGEKLNIPTDGMKTEKLGELIIKNRLRCPRCGSDFRERIADFNLMFQTNVGPVKDDSSVAYLRPETAQLIFTNFKLVQENCRLKLPFGIAQMGRAFRNEIAPRNFLFRCREFEQMEIEYFIHPNQMNECPFMEEVMEHEMIVYSADDQVDGREPKKMRISNGLKSGIFRTPWHAYWLATEHMWFVSLGANPDNFRIRQHLKDELSHYAVDTWDLEYSFPFGWKELEGISNRGDFDLKQHMSHSKKDLSIYDEDTKERVVPHVVAEPSLGVDRTFLVFMFDAYSYDKGRENVVLKLHPRLAPVKAAVFPLLSNKEELVEKARKVFNLLRKEFAAQFDVSGSIGRRYARQDEIGTPFCITVDFESLQNKDVTIRERDTTSQKRVKIDRLKEVLRGLVSGETDFDSL